MKVTQLTLFEVKPDYTEYQIRKWTKKYVEYCNRVYEERGASDGEYCCGYHWCCDECRQTLCKGCADCVHTVKQIARELQIKIDYSDFDFEKFERRIYEAYARYKGWKTKKEEAEMKYTLADLNGDPLFNLFSGDVTLRIRQANGVRNVVVTPKNSKWCLKHYGKYEIAPAGIYPFCQGVDLEEDGIGLPTTYAHLSFAVELVKPAPETEGEEGWDEDGR